MGGRGRIVSGTMILLNVLYFAHVRAVVGRPSETLELPDGATVADAVAALSEAYPGLEPLLPTTRVALDGAFVEPTAVLSHGAELVLIPPVAGGAGIPLVELTKEPLTPARARALEDAVGGAGYGAVVTFQGVVRDHARGHAVGRLEYEAYEPMARAQLEAIVREVEEAHGGAVRAAVHHRVGVLEVGDVAVVIVTASAHRAEAFDACRRVIDRLKEDVPIWKREEGPDGAQWVSDHP